MRKILRNFTKEEREYVKLNREITFQRLMNQSKDLLKISSVLASSSDIEEREDAEKLRRIAFGIQEKAILFRKLGLL